MEALTSIKISSKILPLIEIITELPPNPCDTTFKKSYSDMIHKLNYQVMIDIPLYLNINNGTDTKVENFIVKFKKDPSLKVKYYKMLSSNKNIIPVLSYNHREPYKTNSIAKDFHSLSQSFNRIAVRIVKSKYSSEMIKEAIQIIRADDILIYDADKTPVLKPAIKSDISLINSLKKIKSFTSIIMYSPINRPPIKNSNLNDGTIVKEANNSLLNQYTILGFDAFGDFVGITKYRTIGGGGNGIQTAGFLFYYWSTNEFIGYKGRISGLDEFKNHIKPALMSSVYWSSYSSNHHLNCPGCNDIAINNYTGYVSWKKYAFQHYLYTMEEYL